MNLKQEFLESPPGPEREALVYRALLANGKPTNLKPVSVDGPNGTKITFYVTNDFLNIDGLWLPMSATTAQKIADKFNMFLPNEKMVDAIWKAADIKMRPNPLSGTGYQGIDKFYNQNEVVSSRINASDAAVAYSDRIAEEQAKHGANENSLIAGHMKTITTLPQNGNLGLYGWQDPTTGAPLQGGGGTFHTDYQNHTEYGSGVMLIDDNVVITYPDGKSDNETMEEFNKSDLSSALYGKSIPRYDVSRDVANLDNITPKEDSSLQEIDKILQQFNAEAKIRQRILSKIAEAAPQLTYLPDQAYKDERINTLQDRAPIPEGFKAVPETGYGSDAMTVTRAANEILAKLEGKASPVETKVVPGAVIPFTIGNNLYAGRVEQHWHPAPWNDHWGVTVYYSDKKNQPSSDILEKIDKLLSDLETESMARFNLYV